MAGQLDSLFKSVASSVVKELGTSFDATVTYIRKTEPTYDVATGALTTSDQIYPNLKVPIEFINSQGQNGREERQAKLYLTPDLIGNVQPTLEDTIVLEYGEVSTLAGTDRQVQITDIRTYRGGQEYLYIIQVVF
tara:strand:+ start:32 stop:436 length:405 start_codon:yes stop_codon:yes gene_type:complete